MNEGRKEGRKEGREKKKKISGDVSVCLNQGQIQQHAPIVHC